MSLKPGEIEIGARGLFIAGALFAAWSATLIALLQIDLTWAALLWVPFAVALRSFLNVGLFITAHDAMHGTLYPTSSFVNHAVGRLSVFLYAGFSYDMLWAAHIRHHDAPGTADDPDFAETPGDGLWKWFSAFMIRYTTVRQILVMTGYMWAVSAISVSLWNTMVFWALPALLSALQLFYFGTYQPHRSDAAPFEDNHRARTVERPVWLSFLTCYHFGYHLEHHRYPWVPWWALPALRRALRAPS